MATDEMLGASAQDGRREQKMCFYAADEPRSGRLWTSRTPDMIDKRVRQMLARDRRLTLRLMVEEFGISNDTVCTIVREDLGKWKICSWFVMKVWEMSGATPENAP